MTTVDSGRVVWNRVESAYAAMNRTESCWVGSGRVESSFERVRATLCYWCASLTRVRDYACVDYELFTRFSHYGLNILYWVKYMYIHKLAKVLEHSWTSFTNLLRALYEVFWNFISIYRVVWDLAIMVMSIKCETNLKTYIEMTRYLIQVFK